MTSAGVKNKCANTNPLHRHKTIREQILLSRELESKVVKMYHVVIFLLSSYKSFTFAQDSQSGFYFPEH